MKRLFFISIGLVAALFLVISCAHVDKKLVSIQYMEGKGKKEVLPVPATVTVNDFTDAREDRGRIGADYTTGVDIVTDEPVGISIPQVVLKVLEEKGYGVMRISVKGSPEVYASRFLADFHLAGKIEDLFVSVKREGVLATFSSRVRIYFTLSNKEGRIIWSGRMRGKTSVSSPFSSEKGIEEALNSSIRLVADELASDEKFVHAMSER